MGVWGLVVLRAQGIEKHAILLEGCIEAAVGVIAAFPIGSWALVVGLIGSNNEEQKPAAHCLYLASP